MESLFRRDSSVAENHPNLFLRFSNPFVENLVEGAIEAGGIIVAMMLSSLLYRKSLLMIFQLTSASLTLSFAVALKIIDDNNKSLGIILILLKFFGLLVLGGTKILCQIVTSEVTATSSRGFIFGASMSVYSLGKILSVYLLKFGKISFDVIPWVMSLSLSLAAAVFSFFLPETSGINLPDIEDDVENIGLRRKGDIVKSDNDSSYGRCRKRVDLQRLVINFALSSRPDMPHSGTRVNQLVDTEDANISSPSKAFRDMYTVFPDFQALDLESGSKQMCKSKDSSESSLYSSASFININKIACNSCLQDFCQKRIYQVTKNQDSSTDATYIDGFVVREGEGSNNFTGMTRNSQILVSSSDNLSKEHETSYISSVDGSVPWKELNEDEPKQCTCEKKGLENTKGISNSANNLIDVNKFLPEYPSKSGKIVEEKGEFISVPSTSFYSGTVLMNKKCPKVVGCIPKTENPTDETQNTSVDSKKDFEICVLQLLNNKRPFSPNCLHVRRNSIMNSSEKIHYFDSESIGQNSELQNFSFKSFPKIQAIDKQPKASSNPNNKHIKTFHRYNLSNVYPITNSKYDFGLISNIEIKDNEFPKSTYTDIIKLTDNKIFGKMNEDDHKTKNTRTIDSTTNGTYPKLEHSEGRTTKIMENPQLDTTFKYSKLNQFSYQTEKLPENEYTYRKSKIYLPNEYARVYKMCKQPDHPFKVSTDLNAGDAMVIEPESSICKNTDGNCDKTTFVTEKDVETNVDDVGFIIPKSDIQQSYDEETYL